MDSTQQASGEKQVRHLLVEPLLQRGLAKPSSLTKAQFEEMIANLCARLAYMSPASLMALEEQVAANPAGRERDRLPIANRILEWAALIQPPSDTASPLIRAVFANALGRAALDEGWAPELLAELRHTRRWPGPYAIKLLREKAAPNLRQLQALRAKRATSAPLTPDEQQWFDARLAQLDKCRHIASLSLSDAAAS